MILRSAEPGDAARLYALKRACFGESFLPYTVFASPTSVSYLRALTTPALAPRHPIFVAEENDTLVGYVQAVVRPEGIHLNYIGVHPEWGRRGLGRDLLRAFEREGRAQGAPRATLDVFDSNRAAREWYARAGYRETSRGDTGLLDLQALREMGAVAEPLPPDMTRAAREEETRQGFAKAEVLLKGGEATLGLLGGTALRLMAGSPDLVREIAGAFPERGLLVVSGDLDPEWPLLDRQVSLRMEKRV